MSSPRRYSSRDDFPTATAVAFVAPRSSPSEVIPSTLKVGGRVLYHPAAGEQRPELTGPGVVATITAVHSASCVSLTYDYQSVARVPRGGVEGTRRGDAGTWQHLDMRHKRRLRVHGSHFGQLLTNLEADPTLFDFWAARGINLRTDVEFDVILQTAADPWATYGSMFDSHADRAAALGLTINFGMLTVAGAYGWDSTYASWWNKTRWATVAGVFQQFWGMLKGRIGPWYHAQMETVIPAGALTYAVLAANGRTVAQLRDAMSPYTEALIETGLAAIVRPYAIDDAGLAQVVDASIRGSGRAIVCVENGRYSMAANLRKSQNAFYRQAGYLTDYDSKVAAQMPDGAELVPFHTEGDWRVTGAELRENPRLESPYLPICELNILVEDWLNASSGSPTRPVNLLKRSWYECTGTLDIYSATEDVSGLIGKSSANDVSCALTVASDSNAVSSAKMTGKSRGTPGQVGLIPWRRRMSGGSMTDVTDTTIPTDLLGFKPYLAAANDARCWRLGPEIWRNPDTGANSPSFTMCVTVVLPASPTPGVTYGIIGCVVSSTLVGAWSVTYDAVNGLCLRVPHAGEDIFVMNASPPLGTAFRIVVGYNAATNKWFAGSAGWVTPTLARGSTFAAILLGATHDLLNHTTTVWGFDGGRFPFDEEVLFWHRALTDPEIASLANLSNRWPFNRGQF